VYRISTFARSTTDSHHWLRLPKPVVIAFDFEGE
jgi:hypothetical protein